MKAEHEKNNTKLLRIIVDERYRMLRHIVLLTVSLVVIIYSNWRPEYSSLYNCYRLFCVYGAIVSMCYLNMYILVPIFFFKGRYLLYLFLLSLLVLVSLSFISVFFHLYLESMANQKGEFSKEGERYFIEGFFIMVAIILITTMIKLFQRWIRDNKRIAELNNLTHRMELNELRNQISPHFLFNMLNGIKALIRNDPEKANLVIMKLSEFLRYQLYENNEEQALLKSEINFLSNFLNLEILRRDRLVVDIVVQDNLGRLNGIFIPPNLFTTFVENAVKHSVDFCGGETYVRINFKITDAELYFFCTNSRDPRFRPKDQMNSGLGIANIKRRLELLYQHNYTLTIDSMETQFSILLKLPL